MDNCINVEQHVKLTRNSYTIIQLVHTYRQGICRVTKDSEAKLTVNNKAQIDSEKPKHNE